MKACASLLPSYASDTSGVAAALYDLGGMTVIHDASGCNSTYSTFDEPRWFARESMIYISGLTEMDAILGNDQKLVDDVVHAAEILAPSFVCLCGSPMPMLTGCDLEAIAQEIEEKTGIPSFSVKTNGIHTYSWGLSKAWSAISSRFTREREKTEEPSLNILGASPMDIGRKEIYTDLCAWIRAQNFTINASCALESDLSSIERLSSAHKSLVIAQSGLALARELWNHYGIPYVVGFPQGEFGKELSQSLHESRKPAFPAKARSSQDSSILLLGESIAMTSLARALEMRFDQSCRVISPLEESEGVLGEGDLQWKEDEGELRELFRNAKIIVADPLYKAIAPRDALFIPYGHIAYSGRIAFDEIPDLISKSVDTFLPEEALC